MGVLLGVLCRDVMTWVVKERQGRSVWESSSGYSAGNVMTWVVKAIAATMTLQATSVSKTSVVTTSGYSATNIITWVAKTIAATMTLEVTSVTKTLVVTTIILAMTVLLRVLCNECSNIGS